MLAGYLDRLSDLGGVPVRELAAFLVGLPLLAAAGGWLLSGGEPPTITRHALD